MIKTNSPYYISIPWSGFDSYTLKLYVWSGLQTDVPASPQYEFKNINPLGFTDNSEVNISNYINDFIGLNLPTAITTDLFNGGNVVWFKADVTYPNETTAVILEDAAIKGYTYGIEGKNNASLIKPYFEQKVGLNSVYLHSFIGNSITVNGTTYTNGNPLEANEFCQVAYIKVSEFNTDVITISEGGILKASLIKTDEPKYTPIDIVFLNKNGMLQTITFFKERIESLKVDSESYESSYMQPIEGEHQFRNYNVNGQSSFSINSGFVLEENNEIFKQLFLSNKVWQLKDNVYIPLNLGTSDIEFKTRNKERLLNYKITFKYSFKEINNI